MTTPPVERINGERFCYPDFQPGQVLSHRDLNQLRDYTFTKSMFQNRSLFGYGVACGLRGSIQSNSRLAITAGFALAADGRELRLDEAFTIDIDEVREMPAADFATHPEVSTSAGVGGYTALLVRDDSVTAGACADGCASEADTVCERARIVFARGRLVRSGVSDDPIFDLSPVAPASDFTIDGAAFEALRDAVAEYLRPLLGEATVGLIEDLELDGTPALDLVRVGILNEVLYACWGHARCVAQQTADCFRPGAENALALGWLHQAGSNWLWDRSYRHHFELAPALFNAIFGMRGQDLCGQYLDRIRSMLQTFVVPEVPGGADGGDGGGGGGPGPGPGPGDVHLCDGLHLRVRGCWWFPGEILPIPEIFEPWPIDPSDPWGPWFDRGPAVRPGLIYPGPLVDDELGLLDVFGSGAIRLTDYIGLAGTPTEAAIEDAIRGQRGFEADVRVVPVAEIGGIEGFEPSLFVSTADAIVLGVNEAGAIVATGSVPAARTMREAGTRLPGVQATAEAAATQAASAAASADTALQEATGASGWITDFQRDTLPGLNGMFGDWSNFIGAPGSGGAGTLLDRLQTLERDLITVDQLARDVHTRVDRVNFRVDQAMGAGTLELGAGIRVQDLNRSVFELMQSMQETLVQVAPAETRPQVESALAGTEETMATLATASQDPTLLVTARAGEMVEVMDGMMEGLRTMGATEEQLGGLQGRLDNLHTMLRI